MIPTSLLAAAQAGDRRALADLVVACTPLVRRQLRCWRLSPEDRQDIEQDVLLAVSSSLAEFRSTSSVETWIFRIVQNAVIDASRRRSHRFGPGDGEDPDATKGAEQADALVTSHEIQGALGKLRPRERQAFMAYHALGMRTWEIAEELGVPEPTVRVWLRRCRAKMRRALGGG